MDCIKAVVAGTVQTSFETLLLLNGATPEVQAALNSAELDAHITTSDQNLGFGAGINLLAREACGEYLVLLNDDAVPMQGWLDSLVATADELPDAAIVTSHLIFPDGTLQEAGGMITRAGEPHQVGWGRADGGPDLQDRRDVEYGSAAALLIRRRAFEQVGGFDERYFPAYFEDVDLALRVREAGWRVVYEPQAIVEHAQWGSTTSAQRNAAYRYNQQWFGQRWGAVFRLSAGAIDAACDQAPATSGGIAASQQWERYANWLAAELETSQQQLQATSDVLSQRENSLAEHVTEVVRLRDERTAIESLWMMKFRRKASGWLRRSPLARWCLENMRKRGGNRGRATIGKRTSG